MTSLLDVRGKRALIVPVVRDGGIDEVALSATRILLQHGCRVVLSGDSTLLHEAVLNLCPADTDNEDIKVLHVDDPDCTQFSVNAAVEEAWDAFSGLDLLLCFSTFTGPQIPFLDSTEHQIESATTMNFKKVCLFSIALGKKMAVAGTGGSFVFVTSIIGAERGLFPGFVIPGASIAAVNYITRAMALELGKYKIRVNAVARGLHESDALLSILTKEALEGEGKRIVPSGRWLNKESDLTSMILYLASDVSSFVTGTVVFVDGGQSLVRPRMRSFL